MQRQGERNVRALKRRTLAAQTAVENAPDEETKAVLQADYAANAVKLKDAEKQLKTFCSQTRQRRDTFREQVNGFGRSTAQRAVQAAKTDLTHRDYNDIIHMKGKMSSRDVRKWYDAHDKKIYEHIDTSRPIEEQAKQAHMLRNQYKFQARELMEDQEARKGLDRDFPLHDFSYYFEKYSQMYDNEEDVYKAIVNSSMRPNKEVNKKFGLE